MSKPPLTVVRQRLRTPGGRALVGTLAGNAPGFVLAFAVTAHIGAGRVTDAYAFAWSVALFGISLASTLLEANVLPAAQIARRAGRGPFRRFLRVSSLQAIAGSATAYVVIATLASIIVAHRGAWTPHQQQTAIVVMFELAALVILVGVNSVSAAALYALDEFRLPTLSQAFRGALPLCVLPFLGRGYSTVEVLALLAVIGEAGRSVLLACSVARRSRPLPVGSRTGEVPPFPWRVMAPHAVNMVIIAVNPVVDRTVASSLRPGSVTVVDLAEKVSYVPTLILMSSIVLVAGARWAAWAPGDGTSLVGDYRRTMRLGVAASTALAVTFGLSVVALGVISGPRTAGTDTRLLEAVTLVLLVGLPVAAVASLGSRLLTSTRRTAALPAFAVSAVTLNLIGDIAGARAFGVVGIAGATVLMRGVNAALFWVYARRLIAKLEPASSPTPTRARESRVESVPRIAAEAPR